MKHELLNVFIAISMVVIMAVLANLEALMSEWQVCGRIRISTRDIRAELMAEHGVDCGCSPSLWNGGVAHTDADLSPVQLYDMAEVYTLDGGHYVLECVEIIPCIRVGRWLIGWRGVVKAQGDIIVYNAGKAYRLTRL